LPDIFVVSFRIPNPSLAVRRSVQSINFQVRKETDEAIDHEKRRNDAARDAATFLMNSRVYWEQARNTVETIQPINYYYGGISFLEFITSCLAVGK
jgi:hypothetical protein